EADGAGQLAAVGGEVEGRVLLGQPQTPAAGQEPGVLSTVGQLLGPTATRERQREGILAVAQRLAGGSGSHRDREVVARRAADVGGMVVERRTVALEAGALGRRSGAVDPAPCRAGELLGVDRS